MAKTAKFTPALERALHGGSQKIYRFENGYGASVVDHNHSYGTELAVVHFNSEDHLDFDLIYDTPITDNVIGHIGGSLKRTLADIAKLPKREEPHA